MSQYATQVKMQFAAQPTYMKVLIVVGLLAAISYLWHFHIKDSAFVSRYVSADGSTAPIPPGPNKDAAKNGTAEPAAPPMPPPPVCKDVPQWWCLWWCTKKVCQ